MSRYLCTCLMGISCIGMVIAALPPTPSPAADTDLICHTENPAECYPRVFQPTEDFQIIRDDQDLPPGLHIRMNVYTGVKEARLNIPMDDDVQLEGLPTEQSVVIVDQLEDSSVDDKPALRDQVPQKPPVYQAAGKIVPPKESDGISGDSETFSRAMRILDGNHAYEDAIESALSDLSDLAHDIYYGVELAKRGDVLQHLVALMSSESSHHRHRAASILGGSVQNNPTALKESRDSWKLLMHPLCVKDLKGKTVCEDQDLIDKVHESLKQETDPAVVKAKIYVLAGLTKDPDMRDGFLAKTGMELLLSIFVKQGKQWNDTRIKIAQFVMDTFLDENMGAQLGVWPTHAALDSKRCTVPEHSTKDECWEYHLEKMGDGMDEWRTEFLRLLRESRDVAGGSTAHDTSSDREL